MEQVYNSSSKISLFSNPSHRMSQRPPAIKSGEGVGFEDMGSTLTPRKKPVTYGRALKPTFRPISALSLTQRGVVSEDESDDELLLSSQTSMDGRDATSPSRRVAKGKKAHPPSNVEDTIHVDGRNLPPHPHYPPSTVIKHLKFKKNKNGLPAPDADTEIPPPSSSLTDSQDLFKPISDEIEILGGRLPSGPSSSRQKSSGSSSTRQNVPEIARATTFLPSDTKAASTSNPLPLPTTEETSRPPAKPRPRPHVLITSKNKVSLESTPRPSAQKRDLLLSNKSPEWRAPADGKRTVKKPSVARREPQEFPMSLRAKENLSDGTWGSDASSIKTKKSSMARSATLVNAPKPIPLPSPLATRQVSRGSTFPNLSPLSSLKDKGKAPAVSSDEDNFSSTDGPGRRSGLKPFPMSSQMLAEIGRRSKSPSAHSLKFAKRASSDDSGAEKTRSAKKRKDSRVGSLDTLDHYLQEPMEDDSFDLGYTKDPSKLCCYCDEDLPSHPTPFFQNLLAAARKKSVSDPRPRNRNGLRAPLTIYISVCQRHRFESHQLPIATEKGWPRTIDFSKVPERVKRMKEDLEAIILDKDDLNGVEDELRGPRSKSVFWREVKKEVEKQGSRTVMGVKGQFASFEKTQPGYYGEQGSVIIHQTLFDLFPPSTFDASLIAPLAPAEFIQRILVPEAAVRLIAQDLCLDFDEAHVTLRESAQYGVAMFPDTSENKRRGRGGVIDEDDEMGVADKIVMERARVRRKELAEEEKIEKEMLDEERSAQRAQARKSRLEKAVERAQQAKQNKMRAEEKTKSEVETSDVSEASVTRRTRRGTKLRTAAIVSASETDSMSVNSLTSKRSARVAKRKGDGVKGNRATAQLDGSESSSMELFDDKPRYQASKKNEARERSAQSGPNPHGQNQKKPFAGLGWLDSEEEQESTPRPVKQGVAKIGELGRVLPLQVARDRPGASAADRTEAYFSRHARSDKADSDTSNASRRLERPPIKKGVPPKGWALSGSSSSSEV